MPKAIGRPKKSSEELRRVGARAGRINARVAEEQKEAGIALVEKRQKRGMLLDEFIAQVKDERESFFERLVPEQTVCKENGGVEFNWRPEHALTTIRDYARQIADGSIVAGELTRRACARFLGDLENGATREIFIDPVAVQNIDTWFDKYGEPGMKLQPWELFIVGQLLGWKRPTGFRRFREAWWEVAKKNGKTALMGGLALFLTIADQEPNAEVYSLANARHQAKLCFKAAQHWHEANLELKENVKSFIASFVYSGSTYQFLSSESKTADGPNVAAAFFDEVHEFDNDELFEKITAGCIARTQPLVVSSTTAGNRPESFGGLRHEFFERLLMGLFENDTKFAVIYSLDEEDDFKDESVWIKANPNLGITVKIEGLRDEIEDIKQYPSSETSFLRYHCNRWSTPQEGHSLPPERVSACKGLQSQLSPMNLRNWFLETYADNRCYGGFDYGETSDMCSFTLVFPGIKFPEEIEDKIRLCLIR
jgi:phage terminase large subunit-like protein